MIIDGDCKGLGHATGWVLGLWLGMLAVSAQAEAVTSVTQLSMSQRRLGAVSTDLAWARGVMASDFKPILRTCAA